MVGLLPVRRQFGPPNSRVAQDRRIYHAMAEKRVHLTSLVAANSMSKDQHTVQQMNSPPTRSSDLARRYPTPPPALPSYSPPGVLSPQQSNPGILLAALVVVDIQFQLGGR